jgi:hypothetical protein
MGATPEPERENREQEWHETPHQAGSSQIRRRESKIYPGFCNRAASTVVDGSPGWWGFRELKSSNVKMLQGAETVFLFQSLLGTLLRCYRCFLRDSRAWALAVIILTL